MSKIMISKKLEWQAHGKEVMKTLFLYIFLNNIFITCNAIPQECNELIAIARNYIQFMNKVSQTGSVTFEEVDALFTPDCQKISKDVIFSNSSTELMQHLIADTADLRGWVLTEIKGRVEYDTKCTLIYSATVADFNLKWTCQAILAVRDKKISKIDLKVLFYE